MTNVDPNTAPAGTYRDDPRDPRTGHARSDADSPTYRQRFARGQTGSNGDGPAYMRPTTAPAGYSQERHDEIRREIEITVHDSNWKIARDAEEELVEMLRDNQRFEQYEANNAEFREHNPPDPNVVLDQYYPGGVFRQLMKRVGALSDTEQEAEAKAKEHWEDRLRRREERDQRMLQLTDRSRGPGSATDTGALSGSTGATGAWGTGASGPTGPTAGL